MALDRLSEAAAHAIEDYYASCRVAEQHRRQEEHAATVLQSCWRGVLQRQHLQRLSHVALTIQRCWRGYLGRQRFAAVLTARNEELRAAYFKHQATVIQRCWRGYFSRSRIHDFHKRKAYLAAVAAANAAVRANMEAQRRQALAYQQQLTAQQAKQQFDVQVSRLHHLASTACNAGIFSPPATTAGVPRNPPEVAGQPLEHYLRVASKQHAAIVVKQQQAAIRQTISSSSSPKSMPKASFDFPAGSVAGKLAAQGTAIDMNSTPAAAAAGLGLRPHSLGAASTASYPGSTLHAHSSGSANGTLKGLHGQGKLSTVVVGAVDEWYCGKAEGNMPDGSFNPGLSLQQSAQYEAERQATGLEGRISRGLMLTMHGGQPFNNITKQFPEQQSLGSLKGVMAAAVQAAATAAAQAVVSGSCQLQQSSSIPLHKSRSPGALLKTGGSPNPGNASKQQYQSEQSGSPQQQHWQHNKRVGAFFSKHLKQAY